MTENLNIVETTLRIKGEARRYKKIELTQAFNAHHTIEATLQFEELGAGWLNDPSNIINLIGEKISVTMHNTITGEENYFEGVVTNAIVKGDKSDDTLVVIQGASPTILLDGKKAMDSFADTTLEFAVKESVKNSGNGAEVIAEPQCQDNISYLAQYDETCFEFLNRLSYEYGEWFYYDGSDIKFGRGRRAAEETMLVYSENLSEFDIDATLTPARFARYNYFPYNDKGQILTASKSVHHSNSYLQSAINKSDKAYTSENHLPLKASIDTYQSMETIVNSERGRAAGNMFKIHGKSNTCAVMLAHIVNIIMPETLGMENRQLGIFTVTEVKHIISENGRYYSNDFTGVVASLNDIPMKEPKLPIAQPQIAKVISNADSKGRVKVAFQWQEDIGKTTNWIPVATPSAGQSDAVSQNRGMVFIPEEGDVVNIGFYYNDPSRPYVSGSVFTEFTGKGGGANNNTKSIITRSGIKIVCNDGDGSVYIEDPSGNIVKCDGNKAITITAPRNITLNAGDNMNINVGKDLMLNVGNNQTANIGNAAFMNVMRQIMVSTPFMQQLISDYFHTQAGKALINSQNEVKIESPETSVVGEQKLFMHSAEKAVVNSQGTMEIRGKEGTEDSNQAQDYTLTEGIIEAQAVVHFRPHDKWDGSDYGFDWMRVADTQVWGDLSPYDGMVGKLYQHSNNSIEVTDVNQYDGEFRAIPDKYRDLQREYEPQLIAWKQNNKDKIYFVPWLALYPPPCNNNTEAKLKLIIEINKPTDKLRFKSNKCFKFTPEEINTKGKPLHAPFKAEVTVTCIAESNIVQELTVEAVNCNAQGNEVQPVYTAGKMRTMPNDAAHRKTKKVIMVEVTTPPISDPNKSKKGEASTNMEQINKYLRQSLIEVKDVKTIELNCTNCDELKQGGIYYGTHTDIVQDKTINAILENGQTGIDLFLKRIIYGEDEKYKDMKALDRLDYPDTEYLFVFCFGERLISRNKNGTTGELGGVSAWDYSALCLSSELNNDKYKTIAAHEVCHSLGLCHSFTNSGKFTYWPLRTENLMDYSHLKGLAIFALWHWQWVEMYKNIK